MLVSFAGWGRFVEVLLAPGRRVDPGLAMGWGLVATLALGGLACALRVAARPFLLTQVGVGVLLVGVLGVARDQPRPSARRALATLAHPAPYLVALTALAAVLFDALAWLADTHFNNSDDPPLYFLLARKIVEVGSPFDPFNSRRVTAFGGVDYLNALFLALGREYQLHVVDAGVGALLLFALVVGAVAPRGLRVANAGLLAAPLLLLANLANARINVGSLLTGAAAFLVTYRTFLWAHEEAGKERLLPGRFLVVGACVAAASVLRPSTALPVAAWAALAAAGRHIRTPFGCTRPRLRAAAVDLLRLGLASAIMVLPWLLVFRASTGTMLYPLLKGNATPGFAIVKPEKGLAFNVQHLVTDLAYIRPIETSLLLLMAGLMPLGWGARRMKAPADFVPLLAVVTACGLCFTSYMGGTFEDWVNARYSYAFLVGTCLVIAASLVPRAGPRALTASPRALLVFAAVVAHVTALRDERRGDFRTRIGMIERARVEAKEDAESDRDNTDKYRDVQGHVPESAAIVVAVPEPHRFNMKRNPLFSVDSPGGLGPKPGFPTRQGPDALKQYFLRNGVRYLITVEFRGATMDLLNIDRWNEALKREHNYGAYEAPFVVDALTSLEKLVETHRIVYANFNMTVTDLTALRDDP